MKLLLILLSVLLGIFALLFSYDPSRLTGLKNLFYYEPCTEKINYFIGIDDARFHLPFDDFLLYVKQAANLWSNAYGKKLFSYNPTLGKLEINLYYNRKRDLDAQISWLQNTIVTEGATLSASQKEVMWQTRFNIFLREVKKFDDALTAWEGKESTISYPELVQQQQLVKEQQEKLNTMAAELDLPDNTYIEYVNKLNSMMAEKVNNALVNPEDGLYYEYKDRIDIFFYEGPDQTVHTIAHELGHALGLPHNNNPKSIMYFASSTTLTPTEEDIAALKKACQPKTFFDRLREAVGR